jgi:preprotein translocase subunit SecG
MENVLLVILLLIALALIGAVLMQRSEGGGLGMGGGGTGMITGRPASNAITKLTWGLGIAFMACSVALTIIAAQNSVGGSVVDRLGGDGAADAADPGLGTGEDLLPPDATEAPRAD